MMTISTTQFQEQCIQFIEKVHTQHGELIITKYGKPWVKLLSIDEAVPKTAYIGSFTGVGCTAGDLLEPLEDEWEYD